MAEKTERVTAHELGIPEWKDFSFFFFFFSENETLSLHLDSNETRVITPD